VGLLALLPLYSYDLWDCLVDSLVIMYSIDVNLFPDFVISCELPWFLDLRLYAAQEAQSQCGRSVFSRFLASYFVVLSSGTFSVPFIWIFSLFSTLFYPFVLWLNSNCTFFLWYFVSCVAIGVEIELALGVWWPRWPPNTNRGGRGPRRCGVHMSGQTKKQGRRYRYRYAKENNRQKDISSIYLQLDGRCGQMRS
jgi:hypothetical protein